jgi:hypothetical protein
LFFLVSTDYEGVGQGKVYIEPRKSHGGELPCQRRQQFSDGNPIPEDEKVGSYALEIHLSINDHAVDWDPM